MITITLQSTFQDAVGLLTESAMQHFDQELLKDKDFSELYRSHYQPQPPAKDANFLLNLPEGSFGRIYNDYLHHYSFEVNFFPFEPKNVLRPVEYAAKLLNVYHDLFHVLCEYEASDADEIALESFLLGQLLIPCAIFFKYCLSHPTIHQKKYKHLRDVGQARISWSDLKRGQSSKTLALMKLERYLEFPIADLRNKFAIPARDQKDLLNINTCGIHSSGSFFK